MELEEFRALWLEVKSVEFVDLQLGFILMFPGFFIGNLGFKTLGF